MTALPLQALLVLLPVLALAQSRPQPAPAFPGVEGAGCFATGGRGGAVYRVTNLNTSGPGSLADAVSQPNRIIVFEVSGIIDLTTGKEGKEKGGKLVVDQPNITIAGQTAPGEGICLKGGALSIEAGNVIVRYLRSRRGFIRDTDSGDCLEVKAASKGEKTEARGRTGDQFNKIKDKKAERGKFVHDFDNLSNVIIDHCSTSWATDENLTITHVDRSTVSWSIAAEGLDYTNSKQTPPNHSEGSLWGSSAPDGRATMHHMLYAQNRLRNPRTTGGSDVPAVLTLYNSVIYDWSEYATHTGSERVFVNWVNNYYKPGPVTPKEDAVQSFGFHGDPEARIYAKGNFIAASSAATANNKLAVWHNNKFKNVPAAEREAMMVDQPFGELPPHLQTAEAAYNAVLAEGGATLPARDAVDLRLMNDVRSGTGTIIGKETDLPEDLRWPDYRTLPIPQDSDKDGIPDFWEKQMGLNPSDATDSAKVDHGYSNIEHYFNNTDPQGGSTPIVYIAATISRATPTQTGEWRITRTGDVSKDLVVTYAVSGDAVSQQDFAKLPGTLTIPAGQTSATIALKVPSSAKDNKIVVLNLAASNPSFHTGCPSQSLIVIRDSPR